MADASEWTEYYDENEDRAPREMLLDVLETFGPVEHQAVDLGCGSGIDTLAMLERTRLRTRRIASSSASIANTDHPR